MFEKEERREGEKKSEGIRSEKKSEVVNTYIVPFR
jgi:hypothetical protein